MSALETLQEHGQGYWLDYLSRTMVRSGELARRVEEEALQGVTSNPAIFRQAIEAGADYDEQIRGSVCRNASVESLYQTLVATDAREACDVLRSVYAATGGADGYVSLEVSPHLAHDTQASIDEARHLYTLVGRPNLLIKIPGTAAGLSAVEELLYEGISVNITLLFSVRRYAQFAEVYLRALERRLQQGRPLEAVASVASFFLSRIDTLTDQLLAHRMTPQLRAGTGPDPAALRGRVAVANAKTAYRHLQSVLAERRFTLLAERGARTQRLLWASTSAKNPAYSDVLYVEPLIGPNTVCTMPPATSAAFADHGHVATTVAERLDEAQKTLADLADLGIDFEQVAEQLQNDGIQKFIDPYDGLLETLAARRSRFRPRSEIDPLANMARRLRRVVLHMTTAAGSGHPTSCLSSAEIVAALFFHTMRWDPGDPAARNVDRFVLSKGHAAPILWAALSEAGAIDEDPLRLRRLDSTLEGHPTPNNPWVKVATGSLGQGLAAANGMALAEALPDRFFQCFIAEQNMSGAALGLAVSAKRPFVATFACFLTRAADFIRMAGHTRPPHLVFCGSHAGVAVGQDGPSQMGLEDIALFRALLGSTVLYPADAVSAERLTAEAARREGIVYIRTARGKAPVIYSADERFPVGGSKVLRRSAQDRATIVAAGATVHEALAAHERLKHQGVRTRIIDAYSVKPLDRSTLVAAASETQEIVVVEDHYAEGGLGEAVAAALGRGVALSLLAVREPPRSGTPQELLDRHGISCHAIERHVLRRLHGGQAAGSVS